ncbi:hypothetical protein DFH27DRAFT_526888 [Peziza echinospora]|nr:hypothetical protein DFH27DRAFT_526888 [Peziza echinospora]
MATGNNTPRGGCGRLDKWRRLTSKRNTGNSGTRIRLYYTRKARVCTRSPKPASISLPDGRLAVLGATLCRRPGLVNRGSYCAVAEVQAANGEETAEAPGQSLPVKFSWRAEERAIEELEEALNNLLVHDGEDETADEQQGDNEAQVDHAAKDKDNSPTTTNDAPAAPPADSTWRALFALLDFIPMEAKEHHVTTAVEADYWLLSFPWRPLCKDVTTFQAYKPLPLTKSILN